jgi:hypothetical protein
VRLHGKSAETTSSELPPESASAIGHEQIEDADFGGGTDAHGAFRGAVADSIAEQIGDELRDAGRIAEEGGRLELERVSDAAFGMGAAISATTWSSTGSTAVIDLQSGMPPASMDKSDGCVGSAALSCMHVTAVAPLGQHYC